MVLVRAVCWDRVEGARVKARMERRWVMVSEKWVEAAWAEVLERSSQWAETRLKVWFVRRRRGVVARVRRVRR